MVNPIPSTEHPPVKPCNISYLRQETTALNYEQGTPGIIQLEGWVKKMKASFQPANNADETKNALLKMQLEQLNLISPQDFFHYLTEKKVSDIHLLTHDQLTDHADNFLIQKAEQAASQNTASVVHEKPFLPSPTASSYLFKGAAGFFSLWAGVSQKVTAWFVRAKDPKLPGTGTTGTKDSNAVADATHAPTNQSPQSPTNTFQNTSLSYSPSPKDPKKDHEPANPAVETQETNSNDTDAHASLVLRTNQEKTSKAKQLEKETPSSQPNHQAVNTINTSGPDPQESKEVIDLF